METKDIIYDLRSKINMSQEELAQKVFVTRQAVSSRETVETVPKTETLKLLSNLLNVSINTLLCSLRELRCQCCGMPIDDGIMSRESDGEFNEEYCKWCYSDGKYTYSDMNTLIDFCSEHMANESFSAEQARQYLTAMLPGLKYWREKNAE